VASVESFRLKQKSTVVWNTYIQIFIVFTFQQQQQQSSSLSIMRFCVLVLLTTTVFSSNPLTDSDCEVCMQFVRSSDATKIRDAACRVVQARGEVVDADWKLHSAAMISRDSDNTLLKEIENLVSKNINAELICGYMGVTSHKGGCTCPLSLESFENLKRIIDKVRDSSGSGSTPTDVISALNCPEDSSTTTSLLELGRRTKARRKRKTSSKALLMVTDTDCTSGREKEDKDKTASGIVEQVKPNSGAFKAKANTATSLVIVRLTPFALLFFHVF
jgi:hypothetical protein